MTTKQLTKIYKALSNENRLEIFLNILKCKEKSFEPGCDCPITGIMQNLCNEYSGYWQGPKKKIEKVEWVKAKERKNLRW